MFGCRQCLESNGVDELESKLNVIEEKVCHFSGLSLENLSDLPLTLRIHFSFVAWDFKAFCDNFVLNGLVMRMWITNMAAKKQNSKKNKIYHQNIVVFELTHL